MPTQERTIAYIVDQLTDIDGISARKMFGEYDIWCNGKTVALVCDDQLFIKLTARGRVLAEGADEVPPYPGAKPALRIDAERWEEAEWLVKLVRATADALPPPKKKRMKSPP